MSSTAISRYIPGAQKAGEIMKELSKVEPDRLCIPRTSCNTTTGHLPNDMIERAVTRLGWLGLIYAITLNIVHWTRTAAFPTNILAGSTIPPLVLFSLAAGTVLGIAICVLAWSRKIPPMSMLDVGLVFEVVAAFW